MPERPKRLDPWFVAGVCLAIFVATSVLALHSGTEFRYVDEHDYSQIAQNLLAHQSFSVDYPTPTASRSPGYPWLLVAFYSVWQSPMAAKLVNALALAFAAAALALLTGSLGVCRGRLVAPALTLCYPLFAYAATTLYPQVIGILLFVVVLWLIIQFSSAIIAGANGALYGFLVLLIPGFLLLSPVFPWYILWAGGFRKLAWRNAVLFSICSTLAVLPWTYRNYVQFKTFIPVSSNTGINLLLGNGPNATGNSGIQVDIEDYLRQARSMDEIQQDKFFRQSAMAYVKAHPAKTLKLYLAKVANYFNYSNKVLAEGEISRLREIILFVTYYPLLLASMVRLLFVRRFPLTKPEVLLYVLYFGNAFLSAIFFTRVRLRIPFDALLIALAAAFLGRLWTIRNSQPTEAHQLKTPAERLPRAS